MRRLCFRSRPTGRLRLFCFPGFVCFVRLRRGVLRLLPPDLQPKGFGGMKNKVRSVAGAKVASKL